MGPNSLLVLSLIILSSNTEAQVMPEPNAVISPAREKASIIYRRITGVKAPIDAQILKDMESLIASKKLVEAAALATNERGFYDRTLKQFAAKMSTRDESVTSPLNDFTATLIGIVRDNKNAKELLTGDYIYVGGPNALPANASNDDRNRYSLANTNVIQDNLLTSDNHYGVLEKFDINLKDSLQIRNGQSVLTRLTQRDNDGNITTNAVLRNNPDAAGLLTTRAFVGAHAIAGTNRRMVHYAMREFACIDIAQWADSNASYTRIGRDVDRAPAGDPNYFLTTCKSCHAVMDGFRGAFASLNFEPSQEFVQQLLFPDQERAARVSNTVGQPGFSVSNKYARGATTFPQGYVTLDSTWQNFANLGSNAEYFGWRGTNATSTTFGAGANSFGQILADSQAFSRCMVQRVFRSVCRREAVAEEAPMLKAQAQLFEADYNLKNVFQRIVATTECIGN